MSQETLLDICQIALEIVKKAGAQGCRARVSSDREVELSYRNRKPETLKESFSRGLSVEMYVDGRFAVQSSMDLRKGPLEEFLRRAVAETRLLEEDPSRCLPNPKLYEGRSNADLACLDPDYPKLDAPRRHEIARRMEDACLKGGGARAVSATASVSDGHAQTAVLTSNGFSGSFEGTTFSHMAELTVKDEGDRRPEGYDYVMGRRLAVLPDPESIGTSAAQRTLAQLGGKKLPTQTLPVIVENRETMRVLGGFLGATFGASLQQKQSFLIGMEGKKVGSPAFTMILDPLLPGGLGSTPFDGDGFATKKRTLVESGTLKNYLIDWYYSRKLSREPTTGQFSNLTMPSGSRNVTAIMKDLKKGILVTGFLGGNSNPVTGDFSVGIRGTYFENGELTQPLAEMNIADNHLKFWNKLIETANDPWQFGALRTPSLVFQDVVVSGM